MNTLSFPKFTRLGYYQGRRGLTRGLVTGIVHFAFCAPKKTWVYTASEFPASRPRTAFFARSLAACAACALRVLIGGLRHHPTFSKKSQKNVVFLLKKSTQLPKIWSFVWKFENRPTYCDFEIHNIDPPTSPNFLENFLHFLSIKFKLRTPLKHKKVSSKIKDNTQNLLHQSSFHFIIIWQPG